jgi:hypothetical protein
MLFLVVVEVKSGLALSPPPHSSPPCVYCSMCVLFARLDGARMLIARIVTNSLSVHG